MHVGECEEQCRQLRVLLAIPDGRVMLTGKIQAMGKGVPYGWM